MPVFVELTTDLFSKVFSDNKAGTSLSRRAGTTSARRPLRGLEIKDDTYAILKVVDVSGVPIKSLFDSSRLEDDEENDGSYTNFILQSVSEARMEKNQIVETFGDSYIFFFGESPRFIDVQVVLINSNDFNWKAEWWANYETYFRGSKLTEFGARLYMFYDDNIVEGYMLNAQCSEDSQNPLMVTLTFRMFVTNYSNVTLVGSSDFPVRGSVELEKGIDLNDVGAVAILEGISDLRSDLRARNEEAAQVAIQTNAIAKFGGGSLLAAALRQGLSPASAGIGFSASASASARVGASAAAGFTAGASASASAGAGFGPFASAGAGFTAGASASASAGFGAAAGAGFGPFAQGPAAGTGAAADIASFRGSPGGAAGIGISASVSIGIGSAVFGNQNFGQKPYSTADFSTRFPRDSIYERGIKPAPRTSVPAVAPVRRTKPLRGKIWDNWDEWTGTDADFNVRLEEPEGLSDVKDLQYASLLMLGAYGVLDFGHGTMNNLGLGPKFSQAGVGIGISASVSVGASFGVGAGVSAGVGASIGYTASVGAGIGIGPQGPYAQAYSQSGFTTGPTPGFQAPYANYPGYGQGYGSAAGGPGGGYAPGSLGVGTSSGITAGASYGGGTGVGAATQVGGNPSAFAMESFPGDVYSTGTRYNLADGTVDTNTFSQQAGKAPVITHTRTQL